MKNRDKAFYEHVVNTYSRPMFTLIFEMTKDYHLSEDLQQDCFKKFIIQVNKGNFTRRSERQTKGYLLRIAYNSVIDHYRRGKSRGYTYTFIEDMDSVEDIKDCVTISVESKMNVDHIEQYISSFSSYQQDIIALSREGMKRQQIADRLNVSIDSVDWQLKQIRKMLTDWTKS